MTVDNLGYYKLPLSQEERDKIYPLVKTAVENDIITSIRSTLRDTNMQAFHILRACFEITDLEGMTQEIKSRYDGIFDKLKGTYPFVAELQDEVNTTLSVTFDGDGIPTLVLSPWLKDIVDGAGEITVDQSQVPDAALIRQWGTKVLYNPELRIIPEDKKSLIEFNDKFNELVDDYEIDFTEVIKELVTAVKEGKYK